MRFILDFDRVLFDTDALVARLKELGIDHTVRNRTLAERAVAEGISFESFVREGVVDFLTKRGSEVVMVSSHFGRTTDDNERPDANPHEWQTKKIELSGLAKLVSQVILTAKDKREAFLEAGATQEPVIVLDDELEHLQVARDLGYEAIQFNTKGNTRVSFEAGPRSERERSVDSFVEFTKLVETMGS